MRDGWAEVISTSVANGRHGYVRDADVRLTHTPVAFEVDLSRRLLRVWRSGEVRRAVPVAIGAAVSPTPTGHFAVTDKLYGFNPAAYGCCILALSAHQEHLAPEWPGGDRLAIHGTPNPETVGTEASLGCMRAYDADIKALMRRVPLGAPVFIRA